VDKETFQKRIKEICDKLSELSAKDEPFMTPTLAANARTFTLEELFEYGARHKERQKLHAELYALAREPIT
jgi:hypothetical protein